MKSRALLLLLPAAAFAGPGMRNTDQDAAATARGGAFTATADNVSAVYYNPAGVARLPGVQFRAGVYAVTLSAEYDGLDGKAARNRKPEFFAPQLYATWTPERGPLSVGVGLYAPYGLGLRYADDAPFRTAGTEGLLTAATLNPVLALRVSPTFALGAGLTVNSTEAELRQGIAVEGDSFKLHGSGVNYGWNAGALWQPAEAHSFGVRYHSGTRARLHGHTAVHTQAFTVPTPLGPVEVPEMTTEQDADGVPVLPQFVTLGYSWRPVPGWNLEVGAEWTDWNALDDFVVHRAGADKVTVPFHWRSAWSYQLGITRAWESGWRASAGYNYAEKVVPAATFTPTTPDADQHVFSLGLGWQGERWSWDAAYQHSRQRPREVAQGTSVDGVWRLETHALSVSGGVRF